ncbi:MAG: hypothetical protein EXR72_06550 [Myxococcales bacterium]|nr:hypothetical protein [Myxococcales bacterium]
MNRLRLHSVHAPDGTVLDTWLTRSDGEYAIDEELPAGGALRMALPGETIRPVFDRYARPLDVALPALADDDEVIDLPGGAKRARVRAFQYRGPADVIPNDYLALEIGGEETVAAPGRLIAAALCALARAAARTGGAGN